MSLLIKQAKIIDPGSPHKGKVMDILIEKGMIHAIRKSIPNKGTRVFEAGNLHVSPGWFDMHVNFRDPGHEYKEDLGTGTKAAAAGGFTGVAVMPSTHPPIDSKAGIDYIRNKTARSIVEVFPVGALSQHLEGKDISEMYDMHLAGAAGFSDDKSSIVNTDLMKRALLYTKTFNGIIISFPDDRGISQDGKMNEGEASTMLGLKGIPSLAEEIMVARDISLVDYTGGRIHFSTVSTTRSVELIRQAKAKGLNVTAEVAVQNLVLNDSAVLDFDSNFKVHPPLRSKADIKALINGLKDGTIDAVCSDHAPEDEETKKREFDQAAFGMIGLQTLFPVLNTFLGNTLSLDEMISKISIRPREILGLNIPVIREGKAANLTFFDPDMVWSLSENQILSKSKNTPFIGVELKGRALGIYNKGKLHKS